MHQIRTLHRGHHGGNRALGMGDHLTAMATVQLQVVDDDLHVGSEVRRHRLGDWIEAGSAHKEAVEASGQHVLDRPGGCTEGATTVDEDNSAGGTNRTG